MSQRNLNLPPGWVYLRLQWTRHRNTEPICGLFCLLETISKHTFTIYLDQLWGSVLVNWEYVSRRFWISAGGAWRKQCLRGKFTDLKMYGNYLKSLKLYLNNAFFAVHQEKFPVRINSSISHAGCLVNCSEMHNGSIYFRMQLSRWWTNWLMKWH